MKYIIVIFADIKLNLKRDLEMEEKFNEEENEVWRTIDEFPDYEVSSLGRVRNRKKGLVLKGRVSKRHKSVALNGKYTLIHRIVAKAFPEICGEWHEDYDVHHKDYNPLNNHADNLKICTKEEHHSYHGGEHHPNYGKKRPESFSRIMSVKMKGENNPMYNKHLSEEQRRKISERQKGEKNCWYGKSLPRPTIEASIIKNSKPICQYTLDGKFVREWISATEAGRVLGCCYTSIGKCCKGKQKKAHGFLWRFKNTEE